MRYCFGRCAPTHSGSIATPTICSRGAHGRVIRDGVDILRSADAPAPFGRVVVAGGAGRSGTGEPPRRAKGPKGCCRRRRRQEPARERVRGGTIGEGAMKILLTT